MHEKRNRDEVLRSFLKKQLFSRNRFRSKHHASPLAVGGGDEFAPGAAAAVLELPEKFGEQIRCCQGVANGAVAGVDSGAEGHGVPFEIAHVVGGCDEADQIKGIDGK